MKQEKKISQMGISQKGQYKDLSALTDDEILEGFKRGDGKIVKEYFYGYCRVAYCIYQFKPLEDRKPTMTLKTWMVNGIRLRGWRL